MIMVQAQAPSDFYFFTYFGNIVLSFTVLIYFAFAISRFCSAVLRRWLQILQCSSEFLSAKLSNLKFVKSKISDVFRCVLRSAAANEKVKETFFLLFFKEKSKC